MCVFWEGDCGWKIGVREGRMGMSLWTAKSDWIDWESDRCRRDDGDVRGRAAAQACGGGGGGGGVCPAYVCEWVW